MFAGSLTTIVSTIGALFASSSASTGFPFSPLMFTSTGFRDVSNDLVTSDGTVTESSVYGFSVTFLVASLLTCCGVVAVEAVPLPHILHFFGQLTFSQSSWQLTSV